MKPKSIKKVSDGELAIHWDSDHRSTYSLEHLREACPCAGCQGETILLRKYTPLPADRSAPGRYVLTGIEQVGLYAIQLSWADGHTTGIYSWERLRELCECDECGRTRTGT